MQLCNKNPLLPWINEAFEGYVFKGRIRHPQGSGKRRVRLRLSPEETASLPFPPPDFLGHWRKTDLNFRMQTRVSNVVLARLARFQEDKLNSNPIKIVDIVRITVYSESYLRNLAMLDSAS